MACNLGGYRRAGYAILRAALLVFMIVAGQGAAMAQTARSAACADPAQLTALGHRMLEDSLALRFGQARALVPAFGDWAYDWTQSYLTAYRIAGRAVIQLGEVAISQSAPEAIAHGLAAPVREAFQAKVARPSLADGGFEADMAHLAASLAAEAGDPALAIALTEGLRLAPAASLAEAAGAETVFLRSMRPMAARLGAMVLRVSEAGSVVAFGGYLGYSVVGAPGVLLGVVGGVGLAWGADWAINRVDAGLNRPAFEAQAMAAIDAAEAAVTAQARAAIALAVAQRPVACR